MATPHQHSPTHGNRNKCFDCGGPWNAVQHQPSLLPPKSETTHGRASELPEDLRELARYERPSGAPFWPSLGAPATHTGRPAQHSGLRDQRVIMCPMSAIEPSKQQCPFIAAIDKGAVSDHLFYEHHWQGPQIEEYLADPWYADEARSTWAARTGTPNRPLIPAVLTEEMAEREQNRLEMEALFMNPNIDTEDLFAKERAEAAAIDPDELAKALNLMGPAQLEALLTEWWMDKAEEEVRAVVPKAVAYGSNSLMQLGRKMAQLQKREVTDEEAMELGCWTYVVGKIERWTDSVMRGERPSDDTVYDIGIYVKMTQRLRDVGSWPGLPTD